MPSRSRTQYVSGMSDSPIWNRGKRSRSIRTTCSPRWARRVETVEPAGPPPITTTSGFCAIGPLKHGSNEAESEQLPRQRVDVALAASPPETHRYDQNQYLFSLHPVDNSVALP